MNNSYKKKSIWDMLKQKIGGIPAITLVVFVIVLGLTVEYFRVRAISQMTGMEWWKVLLIFGNR